MLMLPACSNLLYCKCNSQIDFKHSLSLSVASYHHRILSNTLPSLIPYSSPALTPTFTFTPTLISAQLYTVGDKIEDLSRTIHSLFSLSIS